MQNETQEGISASHAKTLVPGCSEMPIKEFIKRFNFPVLMTGKRGKNKECNYLPLALVKKVARQELAKLEQESAKQETQTIDPSSKPVDIVTIYNILKQIHERLETADIAHLRLINAIEQGYRDQDASFVTIKRKLDCLITEFGCKVPALPSPSNSSSTPSI